MFLLITRGSLLERDCQIGSVNVGKNTELKCEKGLGSPSTITFCLCGVGLPDVVRQVSSVCCKLYSTLFLFLLQSHYLLRRSYYEHYPGVLRSHNSFV